VVSSIVSKDTAFRPEYTFDEVYLSEEKVKNIDIHNGHHLSAEISNHMEEFYRICPAYFLIEPNTHHRGIYLFHLNGLPQTVSKVVGDHRRLRLLLLSTAINLLLPENQLTKFFINNLLMYLVLLHKTRSGMAQSKQDIIAQLQKSILPLQGFKYSAQNTSVGLGPIEKAFPDYSFPLGAVHEFICADTESAAATGGFIAGILSSLMRKNGVSLWISSSQKIFAPSLKCFGIQPEKLIFINVKKERDVLWCVEEALKCEGVAAVIGEMKDLDFNVSRRFQLAVEQSRVTGFLIRNNPRQLNTTACIARWQVTSLPSISHEAMPGISFPRWNVELLKVRNGKPGDWKIEWSAGKFRHSTTVVPLPRKQQRKTG
jgi:protein ImuA